MSETRLTFGDSKPFISELDMALLEGSRYPYQHNAATPIRGVHKCFTLLEAENDKLKGRLESHGCLGEGCGCRNDAALKGADDE